MPRLFCCLSRPLSEGNRGFAGTLVRFVSAMPAEAYFFFTQVGAELFSNHSKEPPPKESLPERMPLGMSIHPQEDGYGRHLKKIIQSHRACTVGTMSGSCVPGQRRRSEESNRTFAPLDSRGRLSLRELAGVAQGSRCAQTSCPCANATAENESLCLKSGWTTETSGSFELRGSFAVRSADCRRAGNCGSHSGGAPDLLEKHAPSYVADQHERVESALELPQRL